MKKSSGSSGEGRLGGRDRGYIVLTARGRRGSWRERSLLHCTEVVINLVGAAPVAQFIEGPSCGQEGPGACRSKRLVAGEHPPDRLAQLAGDDDRSDLAATLPAEPRPCACRELAVAAVVADRVVRGLDQRPAQVGRALLAQAPA